MEGVLRRTSPRIAGRGRGGRRTRRTTPVRLLRRHPLELGRSRVVDFDELRSDLHRHTLPRFSWIAPGVWHDGHSSSLCAADRFASRLVPRILRALGPHGVLFVTWDEGTRTDWSGVDGTRGGGHVALIAAGGDARRGATTSLPANHYSLLRIEP